MKTKRQTIWLVSMLSLMVVLSAYYLFTEDSGPAATSTNEGQQVTASDTKGSNGAAGADSSNGAIVTEVTDDTAAQDETASASNSEKEPSQADDQGTAAADTNSQTSKPASDKGNSSSTAANSGGKQASDQQTAKTDEEVLQTAEAQGTAGSDIVNQYQYDRVEANAKKADELYQAMNDLTKTPEENAKAANELNALQDQESKINDIEEQVSQKFGKAVVTPEEDNSFKVVVMNDQLKAKDAAVIIDMVISELGVSQDQVKVQYVSAAK